MAQNTLLRLREFDAAAMARARCNTPHTLRVFTLAHAAALADADAAPRLRRTPRQCTCCRAPWRCAHARLHASLRRAYDNTCLTLRVFLFATRSSVCLFQRTGSAPVSQYFYPQDTGARSCAAARAAACACAGLLRSGLTCRHKNVANLCADASLDGATVQEATFRGRLLRGITHALPDGYQGARPPTVAASPANTAFCLRSPF
jgi:hypothetical protein